MAKARDMVAAYVDAGFSKIHLDASMACADDGLLAEDDMAERAADLCAVAEGSGEERDLSYVVGTEVPIPGGETEVLDALAVTTPAAVEHTWAPAPARHFAARWSSARLERVIGIVVQPGVDFGNDRSSPSTPERLPNSRTAVGRLPGAGVRGAFDGLPVARQRSPRLVEDISPSSRSDPNSPSRSGRP